MNRDLNNPEHRKSILKSIKPENAKNHHNLLREIFALEMDYRRQEEDYEYFENIYHCGLLLFYIGDSVDSVMIWDAKHINMDTGSGFDIETLFGAGFQKTIDYLEDNNLLQLKSELSAFNEVASQEALDKWADFKRNYYYS